jgi:hypothetical protein
MPEETFIFFILVNFGVLHAQSGKIIFFSEFSQITCKLLTLKYRLWNQHKATNVENHFKIWFVFHSIN